MQLTALHGSTNSACVKGCAACLSVRPKRLGGILQCLPPMPPSKRPAPLHVGQAMAARDTHVHVHWHKLELTLIMGASCRPSLSLTTLSLITELDEADMTRTGSIRLIIQ